MLRRSPSFEAVGSHSTHVDANIVVWTSRFWDSSTFLETLFPIKGRVSASWFLDLLHAFSLWFELGFVLENSLLVLLKIPLHLLLLFFDSQA